MAAQMLNINSFKSLLIEEVAHDFNWSDSDNGGYDGDSEEFFENFNKLNLKSVAGRSDDNLQLIDNQNNPEKFNREYDTLTDDDAINTENYPENTENLLTDHFFSFFTEGILTAIVKCTNTHIAISRKSFSRERDCQDTDIEEIKVTIGLLVLIGLFNSNLKLDDLWEKGGLGVEVFRLTMSLRRFKFILQHLHFTCSSKYKQDSNGNDIDEIIGKFVKNCQKNFELGQNVILSRKFLVNRNDSKNTQNEIGTLSGFVIYFIMDMNCAYIGGLEFYDKKNFTDSDDICSSHHEAVSYILEKQNDDCNVILDKSCKPFEITQCRSEKFLRVDAENTKAFTTEELLEKYSVVGRAKRFLLKLWFILIDVACLNSFVIHHINISQNLSRKQFLKKLGLALVTSHIKKRTTSQYLSRQLRDDASNFLSMKAVPKTFDKTKNKPVRCVICPRKADKKVRTFCSKCEKHMCQSHMITLCCDCQEVL